jgi:hypothetical protein
MRRPRDRHGAPGPGLFGPVTSPELASLGLHTAEDLRELGWEEVCIRWVEAFPLRLNLNAFYGLIAAVEGVDWRSLDENWRTRARTLRDRLARDLAAQSPASAPRMPRAPRRRR